MEQYTDFLTLAAERYSVRQFAPEPIAQEQLDQILRAGQLAPTAHNNQPQKILVIRSEEGLQKLQRCTNSHFYAPVALLVCFDRDECWVREYDAQPSGTVDASIVCTHLMLQAAALGIGSTWVMHFIPEAIRTEFAIPARLEPTALLVMGYPAADAQPSPRHADRKPLEQTVCYDAFPG